MNDQFLKRTLRKFLTAGIGVSFFSIACSMQAAEYHVAKNGQDANASSAELSLLTIQAADDAPLVTSDLLGVAKVPNQRFEQPDGTPYLLNTDYFGKPHNTDRLKVGSFASLQSKSNFLNVWSIEVE